MATLNYPRCMVCGYPANAGGCKECQKWYCKTHIWRHPNCKEGR